jgi:hypothetical protein
VPAKKLIVYGFFGFMMVAARFGKMVRRGEPSIVRHAASADLLRGFSGHAKSSNLQMPAKEESSAESPDWAVGA